MNLDERLEYIGRKLVGIAKRDLRRHREARNLIKEVIAFGDDEKKLQLISFMKRERPEVVPPDLEDLQ